MARPRKNGALNIAQLERLLESRRRETNDLLRERAKLQQRIDTLDRRIAQASGGARFRNGAGAGGGRARNPKSLTAVIETVLSRNGKPMKVGDVVDAVEAEGYRSGSANFRAIVNQTLIKDKRFSSASRGVYQLKK